MNSKQPTFFQVIWDFFCSLKLTIITLILLALTSIIGTVIQQNRSQQEYLELYGKKLYDLFETLQFFSMYQSWWFLGLLTVISLNLTACSIKRFPRVWKTVTVPLLVADEGHYKSLANGGELRSPLAHPEALRRLTATLGRRFAPATITEQDGKTHIYAEKGAWSRFGVYVTHLSILVVFAGAIIGNIWGFKAYVNIEEGTSTDKVWIQGMREPLLLGFSLRCDDFAVTYYDGTNRPREFMSILDVVDGGREVISDRKIVVNDPLSYKGITFYQSSYGPAGNATLKMRVKVRDTGEILEFSAREGEHVPLPDGGSFAVTGYAASYERFGPAIQMHVNTPDGQHGNPFIVLQNFAGFDEKRGGTYSFTLLDYEQKEYTGLQVKKDPGVWVVWLGCLLMIVGSIAAFSFSHRRIWVRVEEGGSGSIIRLGGNAHRNQPAFALFFDELSRDLGTELDA